MICQPKSFAKVDGYFCMHMSNCAESNDDKYPSVF